MNKYQEALDVLYESAWEDTTAVDNSKLKLQELVDKKTPKKPKINHYDNDCIKVVCPNNCGIQLNGLNKDNEIVSFTHEYCPKCGQAIDWSKDE